VPELVRSASWFGSAFSARSRLRDADAASRTGDRAVCFVGTTRAARLGRASCSRCTPSASRRIFFRSGSAFGAWGRGEIPKPSSRRGYTVPFHVIGGVKEARTSAWPAAAR